MHSSPRPARGFFIKRVTQMSQPRFVYILGNCCGRKKKKKPLYAVKHSNVVNFRGAEEAEKIGLRAEPVSNQWKELIARSPLHTAAHTHAHMQKRTWTNRYFQNCTPRSHANTNIPLTPRTYCGAERATGWDPTEARVSFSTTFTRLTCLQSPNRSCQECYS
jgi:hypothetical protein